MQRNYQQNYVVGSAARKLEVVAPQVPQERKEQKEQHREQQRVKANAQQAKEFNLQYIAVLGVALVLVVSACINYLKVQSQIVTQKKEIALLQADLTEMKEDNRINYERVMGSVSLSEIFRIATEELGMVYSTNDQVIYYDSVNPDYVKQYEDIPE
ncbi:MAG: hypothetical protein IJA10_05715 [Lachnospiraceae bacterium]|nr:hypothetical protein [Lachnospiraceae bacterium]